MLLATQSLSTGDVTFRSQIAFERAYRVHAVMRTGTVWDTRFAPNDYMGGGRFVLSVLLDGWAHWHSGGLGTRRGPSAYLLSIQPAGSDRRTSSARSLGGNLYRAVDLIVTGSPSEPPLDEVLEAVELPESVYDAARAIVASAPEDGLEAAVNVFLDRVGAAVPRVRGLTSIPLEEESPFIRRIWDAFAACDLSVSPFPSMQDLMDHSGLSLSHFSRQLKAVLDEFRVDWEGWRGLTNDARIRWVLVLLSNPGLSIADVARAAGYSSTDALDATLRRMNLPPPTEVRRQIVAALPDLVDV
jgi:AraC-like DNA-binding protein